MGAHRQFGGRQSPPPAGPGERPAGDPWHAFGYVVAGVGVYGFLGWLCDRWLGTTFLVAVGILLGACFGIYLTFARFSSVSSAGGTTTSTTTGTTPVPPHPTQD